MELNKENVYAAFEKAADPKDFEQLQRFFDETGYSGFNHFLHQFRESIRRCGEEDVETVRALIQKARQIVPDPKRYSPSWEGLWETLDRIVRMKEEVFREIGPEDREGEWQVLVDNPYTHQEIVCHPGLRFEEAAFLYAYFRLDLQKNEYIRLQKVVNVLMTTGRGPFPVSGT